MLPETLASSLRDPLYAVNSTLLLGMVEAMVVIAKHSRLLERLGLSTVEQVRAFQGDLVKNHRGHRDIHRITTQDESGRPLVLYLKRNLKPYKKDGLHSLWLHGAVWSVSRQEWENARILAANGFEVATPVAYGEVCGALWEHFSFLITEGVRDQETLEHFLQRCRDRKTRLDLLLRLAASVMTMHRAGLANPDLLARHIFLDPKSTSVPFRIIDLARLEHGSTVSLGRRARDLAALHLSVPQALASLGERLRFLRWYLPDRTARRRLLPILSRRVRHLLKRSRYRAYFYREGG